jgi:chromosome segregation ATPase
VAYKGIERRKRKRGGRSINDRRLDYWRELERHGKRMVGQFAEQVPAEWVSHHEMLDGSIEQHVAYLQALRETIEAEEQGFRALENKYMERIERDVERHRQMVERLSSELPDSEALAQKIGLAEEQLEVLEGQIADVERRTAGEVTDKLRDLRLERIRRQRKLDQSRKELVAARRGNVVSADPRVVEIASRLGVARSELADQEAAIDGRLVEHQGNLASYSEALALLRSQLRDHLIKVGDAAFNAGLGDDDGGTVFERLVRLVRDGAD